VIVKVAHLAKNNQDSALDKLITAECLLFLQRPSTKPSHRIYCLGFLNKFASVTQLAETRAGLLQIYFGLFNKVLHTNPTVEPVKKDRSLSKKDRIKVAKKQKAHKLNQIDEEDNKVTELVLKGINVLML
jgi:hypothetical protein